MHKRSILAHRGMWNHVSERNTIDALERAVAHGYGIETDVRDCMGRLVISHDMPTGGEIPFLEVAGLCAEADVPLAINVKADGLAEGIENVLKRHPNLDAFCFDMSVPQLLEYQKRNLPTFTRVSEFEAAPSLYEDAKGVWLDAFVSDWYEPDVLKNFLNDGKRVAVVSSELHHRRDCNLWATLRDAKIGTFDNVMLCTDMPDAAIDFFRGKAE